LSSDLVTIHNWTGPRPRPTGPAAVLLPFWIGGDGHTNVGRAQKSISSPAARQVAVPPLIEQRFFSDEAALMSPTEQVSLFSHFHLISLLD
jgi:hypothetical protein